MVLLLVVLVVVVITAISEALCQKQKRQQQQAKGELNRPLCAEEAIGAVLLIRKQAQSSYTTLQLNFF